MQESNENIRIKRLDPFDNKEEIGEVWRSLQARSIHSFFTSWGWMRTWLESLPSRVSVELIVGYKNAIPEFCCFLSTRRSRARWLFVKNKGYMNATGDARIDSLCIEYNAPLMSPAGVEFANLFAAAAFGDVEEFHLPGVPNWFDFEKQFDGTFLTQIVRTEPSYFVDLDDLRRRESGYLQCLSSSRRSQIRRSIKQVGEQGTISIVEAQSASEALEMLERLSELHQIEWVSRGEAGAFASPHFVEFHRSLIKHRFDAGEIQLLCVHAGDHAIGFLYNFLYQHQVLFYQSGFDYAGPKKSRPGIVSHYLAIEHNLSKGMAAYNFLAGDSQYKKSLSTGNDELNWVVSSRINTKSHIERWLVAAKRRLVG